MVVFRRKTIRERISKDREKISVANQAIIDAQRDPAVSSRPALTIFGATADVMTAGANCFREASKLNPTTATTRDVFEFSSSQSSASSSSTSSSSSSSSANFQRVIIREKILKSSSLSSNA